MSAHAPLVLPLLLAFAAGCSTTPARPPTDAERPPRTPIAFEARPAMSATPRAERAGIPFGDERGAGALEAFFPGAEYDARVPRPDELLRHPLGTFTARHDEVLAALRAVAAASDRVRIAPFGRTHEGRELVQVVIASPENLARLDDIRSRIAQLADPRGVDASKIDAIVRDTPAIAWLGYSIHGDETSGTDASVAVAHHLAAGTGADVRELLANVVVVIDPCQNPDGRERVLSMFETASGYVPDLDADSMRRGRWPYGRENHFLFDMNRDWIWGTQPETRARWHAIRAWHPQLLVDAHEMGPQDTYLFYPATDPFSPHFPAFTRTWWSRYAADQSAAFDQHGWSYYTREWADSWYVGYTDSWATFQGACGILYEQARYGGGAIRRRSGEIATYRDAVRRQAVASIANVTTLAKNRAAVLRDYVDAKLANVSASAPGNDRAFVLVPGREAARERQLILNLVEQGVEVFRSRQQFRVTEAEGVLGKSLERDVPAGAFVVPARQPLSPLVQAMLAFDPRFDTASLERERREVERKGRSKIYDVTAWSPAHAFDVDALWCAMPGVDLERFTGFAERPVGIRDAAAGAPAYGWIVDGADDASVAFAARALEAGLAVQASDEPFRAAGREFTRGSLLVRRVENGSDVRERVERAARAAGVVAHAVSTARSADEGPDLGGQHFDLLERPRVALLSNAPVSSDSFGHAWHALDVQYGVPLSLIDAQAFGDYDLRRYNVLVVPAGGESVVREHADAVRTWVRSGGTLIALGSAAHELADPSLDLCDTRRRMDALEELAAYRRVVARERAAGRSTIDPADLWDARPARPAEGAPKADAADPKEPKADEARELDQHAARFSPQGVVLRGEVNPDSWITAGCGAEMPVFFDGSGVLLTRPPTWTAVRLAASERLRLSGLLWPEARERIADSAWLAVERRGAGQVILFASTPVFRGWFQGTTRLFANAVVYGPGLGARAPAPR